MALETMQHIRICICIWICIRIRIRRRQTKVFMLESESFFRKNKEESSHLQILQYVNEHK